MSKRFKNYFIKVKNTATLYAERKGDRWAGSTTYFAILSLFPLLAIIFSVLSFVANASPEFQATALLQINQVLPGFGSDLETANLIQTGTLAGVVGLGGLLYAGLGWVAALRDGMNAVYLRKLPKVSFIKQKTGDFIVLLGLGGLLVASVLLSLSASLLSDVILEALNIPQGLLSSTGLKVLGYFLSILSSGLVFFFLLRHIPQNPGPRKASLQGSLIGGVGLEVLKVLGAFLITRTTENPVYGSFALVVGLLVWVNFMFRLLMFATLWASVAAASLQEKEQVALLPSTAPGLAEKDHEVLEKQASTKPYQLHGIVLGVIILLFSFKKPKA